LNPGSPILFRDRSVGEMPGWDVEEMANSGVSEWHDIWNVYKSFTHRRILASMYYSTIRRQSRRMRSSVGHWRMLTQRLPGSTV